MSNGIIPGREYIFVPRPDSPPHIQGYHGRTVRPQLFAYPEAPDEYRVDLDGPLLAYADELVDPEE